MNFEITKFSILCFNTLHSTQSNPPYPDKYFQGEANLSLASHLVIISRKGLSVCLSLMLKKFLYLKYLIHSCSFFYFDANLR